MSVVHFVCVTCPANSSESMFSEHILVVPTDTLPNKLLFGEVKSLRPPGCPRSSLNEVALRDSPHYRMSRPYRDAQHRLL